MSSASGVKKQHGRSGNLAKEMFSDAASYRTKDGDLNEDLFCPS
jgi:hypothetical protein